MTNLAAIEQKLDTIQARVSDVRTNPPVFMTTKEVAAFLGVSAERVFQWRQEGTGPTYCGPTSRTIRYHRDDVIAWMKEGV